MSKRVLSTQTLLPWSRQQFQLYVLFSGMLVIGAYFGLYRWLIAINDALWLYAVSLMLAMYLMFVVLTLPFRKVNVVDFYADHVEVRRWHFWSGRGRVLLQRLAYADMVQVQCIQNPKHIRIDWRYAEPMQLRALPRVCEFLQQQHIAHKATVPS
ncbi:hypothetical protein LVJ82_02870 [Vitreoscilla massiliensis]|uniref:DUF304 domain-containing protein n=1 Tax=Vitreoscilla massiliensis TaxID=1689272 RepID=A0ABY4E2E3_9NEIS|nr:hypothetical protein [Vitreoscilla massiliensis]UOO89948.1 hypothetical protein LVJ82_02870 [Vitreoscilla massiliensis]